MACGREFEVVRDLDPESAAKRLAAENEEWLHGLAEYPERFLAGSEPPAGDRWFFDDPLQVELLFEGFREYARQGAWATRGRRSRSCSRGASGWRTSRCQFIYGTGRRIRVPLATQEFAAETIPDARFTIWPDAGHFGTAKYWSEVLEAVTASL